MLETIRNLLTILSVIITIISANNSTDMGNYFWHNRPNFTIKLRRNFTKYFYVNNKEVYSIFSDEEEPQENLTFFPKCCPPGMNYNRTRRGCYSSANLPIYHDLGLKVNVIKSGLSDCDVVVDHPIEKKEFSSIVKIDVSSKRLSLRDEVFQYGSYCLDDVDDAQRILRVCYDRSYCDSDLGLTCVQKCCVDGAVLTYEGHSSVIGCRFQQKFGLYRESRNFTMGNFAIFHHWPDCTPTPIFGASYTMDEEGILLEGQLASLNYFMSPRNYCIETLDDHASGEIHLYMCVDSSIQIDRSPLVETIEYCLRWFSLICLIMVMVIYYSLYRLKKLIHMVIFSYCLASVSSELPFIVDTWEILGIDISMSMVMFTVISESTWLNVLCYDICHAIRSLKQNVTQTENLKKMAFYSMYGWLLPAGITIMVLFEIKHACLLKFMHLKRKHLNTVLVFLPIATFSIINAVCFILTICYIIRAKSSLKRFRDNDMPSRNNEVVFLYTSITVKLFLLMGVTNLITTIHTIVHMDDFKLQYNQPIFLQMIENVEGVVVFVVLVLKWKCIKSAVNKSKIFSIRYMRTGSTEVHKSNN